MPPGNSDERVIIIAPIGQDAAAMANFLEAEGFQTEACSGAAECALKINEGASALLLTEEALELPDISRLLDALKQQPSWSELPLIILTSGGESRLSDLLDLTADAAGSVTLLERPMRAATLLRSVQVALRSRRRQYQVRNLLLERERAAVVQARLAAIVESSDDAIVSKTLEGIIQSWNRGAERILGYTPDEVVGRPISIIIPADRLDEERATLEKLRRGEYIHHFETIRITKDGRTLDVSLSISPLRDSSGKVIGASKILRDITERKRAESALRESEERFRTLAENIPQLAWMSDASGSRFWFNHRWLEYTGVTPGDMRTWAWETLIHQDHFKRVFQGFERSLESGDRWEDTFPIRGKSGAYRWFLARAFPIRDADGRITRWFGTNTDIDERKNFEAELERLVAERTADLRATNEQLETFIYSVAHDLRAPLRSMAGYSQLLLDDHSPHLDERGQDLLKRIQASSEFMDKLLLDLLAYGRAARAEMHLGPVQVQKAWQIALYQCSSQIEQTHAQVVASEPLPVVHAHEGTLGQILTNLLNNALKFVRAGAQPKIHFRAEDRGEHVRLWIEDNGVGIPVEQHERVFRVFERLHGSQYPGTGIGLSIVRKGTERMNGKVGLESAPGHGSRFWIELPKAD